MAEFKRQGQNNFWHSPLMLGVIFCVVALFMYNMIGLVTKERDTAKKKALILGQIDTLKKRESDLTKGIDKLKTEDGTEETIRDKYQVVKPGEKMLVIADNSNSQQPVQPSSNIESDHSIMTWFKNLFK